MTFRVKTIWMATGAAVLGMLLVNANAAAQCVEGCEAIHVLTGESAGDQFGWVSNDLGDLDGDGVNDFAITAIGNDGAGTDAGRIYVYSGVSGREIFRASGQAAFWQLGDHVDSAGDVNGDGVEDVIAGAPGLGAGNAVIYSGASRGVGDVLHTFSGEGNGDRFGDQVDGGGDFNGDGVIDVCVGAPNHDGNGADAGRVYIYSGDDYQLICSLDGFGAFDGFGSGLSFIGDVNADGRDDVAISAVGGGSGRVHVYYWTGKACKPLYNVDPPGVAVAFGAGFVSGEYDVNNDGTPDFYAGDFPANRAHIFSGVDGDLLYELSGDNNGQFGIGRIVRDVDGDGHADMLMAAWISDAGAPDAGKAFLYSGKDGSVMRTYTHNIANATFGFDANGMNDDVNGDGFDDFLVTAAWDAGQRGTAYIIAGEFGAAPIGDLDGDGSVGAGDLIIMLGAWGGCGDCGDCPADLDDDCLVGTGDLVLLLGNWG